VALVAIICLVAVAVVDPRIAAMATLRVRPCRDKIKSLRRKHADEQVYNWLFNCCRAPLLRRNEGITYLNRASGEHKKKGSVTCSAQTRVYLVEILACANRR
jgi:hypothetical protein